MKELVICHFNENLSWVDSIRERFDKVTVYTKGKGLPNIGRECHTMLHHIIRGEHADQTVFCQGSPFPHTTPEALLADDGTDFQFLGEIITTDKWGQPHMGEFDIPMMELFRLLGVEMPESWDTGAYSMLRASKEVLSKSLLTPKPYLAMAFSIIFDSGEKTIHQTRYHERGAWAIERMWRQILL